MLKVILILWASDPETSNQTCNANKHCFPTKGYSSYFKIFPKTPSKCHRHPNFHVEEILESLSDTLIREKENNLPTPFETFKAKRINWMNQSTMLQSQLISETKLIWLTNLMWRKEKREPSEDWQLIHKKDSTFFIFIFPSPINKTDLTFLYSV